MRAVEKFKAMAHDFRIWTQRDLRGISTRFWFVRFFVGRESAYGLHMRVKRDGYDAYMRGEPLDANPYPNALEIDELPRGSWDKGWLEGQAVMCQARQMRSMYDEAGNRCVRNGSLSEQKE